MTSCLNPSLCWMLNTNSSQLWGPNQEVFFWRIKDKTNKTKNVIIMTPTPTCLLVQMHPPWPRRCTPSTIGYAEWSISFNS